RRRHRARVPRRRPRHARPAPAGGGRGPAGAGAAGGSLMAGLLVVMGSGETAPTMVKPHRAIFERVGDRPALLLDTPYGFQENADDITEKAIGYFAASVGRSVSALSWRTPPISGLDRDRALARLDAAGWVFAGPGSPTYALRQWADTPIPEALAGTLERGGVVVFA